MSTVQIRYEEVIAEVHNAYAATIATLVNELAEARAQLKVAGSELERLSTVARNEAS